ncbi:MAG: hypothetical protein KJI72_03825 [Patescibacteria group bacterium]|nr:hypothetical protein [Patescibacteria group bacterium]
MLKELNLKILKEMLDSLEQRVAILEKKGSLQSLPLSSNKVITLAELRRNVKIKNGQQSITIIIGYYEKILNQGAISPKVIEEGWLEGKFDGKYNSESLRRAIADGLVRRQENSRYDLSITGENFFQSQLNNT